MKNRRIELVRRKFISDKGMWIAVAYLLFIIVIAVGIQFTDLDPNAMNLQKMLAAPDEVNIFGTDESVVATIKTEAPAMPAGGGMGMM